MVRGVDPQQAVDPDVRAELDRLVDGQLRAEHDGDLEGILASMADVDVAMKVAFQEVFGRELG
jgi:hypothetical protein